jgi:hypothetical protein
MMIIVAFTMLERISFDASYTTASAPRRSPSGRWWFSLSRRKTFSTSIIASSTSAPIAIAIPPSVIVFTVIPSSCMAKIATTSDSGMATSEIAVARRFHRKRKRTMTTSTAPSRSAVTTFPMATEMKSDCPEELRVDCHPLGQHGLDGGEFALDARRQLQRVGARLFLHRQHHARGRVHRTVAVLGRTANVHLGHLRQQHRHTAMHRDHGARDVVHRLHAPDATNHVLLPLVHVHAAGGIGIGAARRAHPPRRVSRRRRACVPDRGVPGTA